MTVMANLGLRRDMEEAGVTVVETKVGDRYVIEEMARSGAVLGGEQSGHVVFGEQATTGDGMLTAVRFLSLARRKGATIGQLAAVMRRYPQVLKNVRVPPGRNVEEIPGLWDAVRAAEEALDGRGRVLVRPSGTEPVVRVMVEAETEDEATETSLRITRSLKGALRKRR